MRCICMRFTSFDDADEFPREIREELKHLWYVLSVRGGGGPPKFTAVLRQECWLSGTVSDPGSVECSVSLL